MNNTENKGTPIGEYGKFGLIEHLAKKVITGNNSTVSGIGDDSAVIESGENLTLVSTDLFLEGIHFG